MATLEELWTQARNNPNAVPIDTEKEDSVVYRGVKVIKNEEGIRIYSTETEFYIDITDDFNTDSFIVGVNDFLIKKYLRKLDSIERAIKLEMNNNKNHKKVSYLKAMRETYLSKYNEVNT